MAPRTTPVEVAVAAGAHVVRHPLNLGQGAALQTGIDYAVKQGADFIVTFDADGQHAAAEIAPMVQKLVETQASTSCSAVASWGARSTCHAPRRSRCGSPFVSPDSPPGSRSPTPTTAFECSRARPRSVVRIRQNRMAHASEFLDEIASKKLRFVEFPVTITYTPVLHGQGSAHPQLDQHREGSGRGEAGQVIFSSILTVALLGLLIYALLQRSQFPLVARILPLVCLSGIYVAWFPESTSDVASLGGRRPRYGPDAVRVDHGQRPVDPGASSEDGAARSSPDRARTSHGHRERSLSRASSSK